LPEGCHSGLGVAFPHSELPIGGGRGDPKPGGPGGPQGVRTSPTALRGPGLAGPQPCPTVPADPARRFVGAGTTSSSSAARAEDPRMPFGLGERRLGDPDPDPGVSPVGLAIGARGLATGPGSGTDARLLGPADIGGGMTKFGVLGGGPIGVAAGGIPRPGLKVGSKGGPEPKFRGSADGARAGGGGPCCMEGPGPKPYGVGVKGTLGEIEGGGNIPGPCAYIGVGGR